MTPEQISRSCLIDAIVGVGFPHPQIISYALESGLSTDGERWAKSALDTLSTDTLQELYVSLKNHEVTHAS